MDDAFTAPGDTTWQRIPTALAWYRRLVTGAGCLALGAGGALLLLLWGKPVLAGVWAALVLVAAAVLWFLAGRFQRSWGYAEATAELYLTYGVLVRQLVVVPYGRMQVVDVTADLLEQALGIATVRVRTAASTADTRVVGLPLADAVQLRDRLAARSESFSTGL
ncbi:PH domain-containing protein [Nocardiopsis ganjiahuensis]|uniref:PH domain-containing protein n=1 Tax=Nocardiopsis ganjiahuensis TaxID=239984 RepID=UPI00035C2971